MNRSVGAEVSLEMPKMQGQLVFAGTGTGRGTRMGMGMMFSRLLTVCFIFCFAMYVFLC
jgi:hypothetical protein